MAPLTQALRTSFLKERGGVHVYSGEVDKMWTLMAVPQGGYSLGLIVSACVSSQAGKTHAEIAHVSAHFYRATSLGHFEVHIRTRRTGTFYSNMLADLMQKNEVKISAQLIFKAPSVEDNNLTLLPPSPYARRVPLHTHPSVARLTSMWDVAGFKSIVKWSMDKKFLERNRAMGQGKGSPIGGGGLEWGAWLEFMDPADNINVSLLPFLGDMLMNLPDLLPHDQIPSWWHPTMVFSLEYKARIPDDPMFSTRTVGLYSCGRFMHEGRHDAYVEIWTAPSGIGEGVEVDGWREKQICLGIAYQMALTVPASVSKRKTAPENSKL